MKHKKLCAELMFVLEQVPYSYSQAIPKEVKDNIKNEMSIEHYNSFDQDKTFYEQDISEETLETLLDIYDKYWK